MRMNNRPAEVVPTALSALGQDFAWLADETGIDEDTLRQQFAGTVPMDVLSASVIAEALGTDLPSVVADIAPLHAEVEVAA